jgi:hypothetical protein
MKGEKNKKCNGNGIKYYVRKSKRRKFEND